jgi:Mg-chelatase subunit ChlD
MPQDAFAHTDSKWWEGGQKINAGETFRPRRLNTPLDKLARKQAGRRSLTRTERKHGRYIKARPANDKMDDIAFDATAPSAEGAWHSPSKRAIFSARSASNV